MRLPETGKGPPCAENRSAAHLPRRIGIRDVAQRAGVAISTVSKVFSGKGEVMPALRMRVLDRGGRTRLPAQLGRPEPPARRHRPHRFRRLRPVRSVLGRDRRRGRVRAPARPAIALLVMSSNHDPETDAANVGTSTAGGSMRCWSRRRGRMIAGSSPPSASSTGRSSRSRASSASPSPSTRSAPIIARACARPSTISSASATGGSRR